MRLVGAALLVLISSIAALAQIEGEVRRYFNDWLAACRPDGYCSATAYQYPNPGDGRVADYVLRIGRHAAAVYWEISLTTVAAMADQASPFAVAVDGEPLMFSGPDEIAAFGAANDFFFLGPGAQVLMDRLIPGAHLAIDFADMTAETHRAGFSLAGLTASLIWIDEQQKRLGSERVAEAPPVGLSAAGMSAGPNLPVAAADLPPVLLAQRNADTDCQPLDEIVNREDIEVDLEFGDGYGLYILPCWGAAYNFGWKAYVERFDNEFAVMAFAEFSPTRGWTATTHLVNYGYDPADRTITTFDKGRGLGDCGTSGLWQWDEFEFVLLEFRAKEECDEQGDPGEFPVVYDRNQDASATSN